MSMALLYLFTYTSWGLGLLSALMALSMKISEHSEKMRFLRLERESRSLELMGKKGLASALVGKLSGGKMGLPLDQKIPEELQNLIDRSPGHPEVSEIEPGDQVMGIMFKGPDYPPSLDPDEDE
jgi:hypothetical protein